MTEIKTSRSAKIQPKSEASTVRVAKLPLLKAEGVTKVFIKDRNRIEVLKGVDFTLHHGEMVAITGASGVGKSTLLHILGTLETPTEGRVVFGPEKQDLFELADEKIAEFRNRNLGFVFQFHYLLPEFDALENVMMPALIAGMSRTTAEAQARELLEFVGLGQRLAHRPAELSGGEQQRVALARAVILKPKLLLADEPTGNLDSENSQRVLDLLTELNRKTGVSILMVTHDPEIAKKMHRVLPMKDGRFLSETG